MRKLKKFFLATLLTIFTILLLSNVWIVFSTSNSVYNNSSEIGVHEVGLVLGTSNKRANGEKNPFFTSRIQAAAKLYKEGKVKYLIVSGDNRSKYYNEPLKMQQALIAKGVPENVITMDYAGLRTLDSVIRCKEVFDQKNIIIISQQFHCYRALFISNYYDMNASGFATEKLPLNQSLKVILREVLARPIAVWDTYLINKKPKFLGDKEPLNRGLI